jgi:CheY-like chemotaxis protein
VSAVEELAARSGLDGNLGLSAKTSRPEPAAPTASSAPHAWSVLVVEDDDDQRSLWQRTLDIFGDTIEVRCATNGYEGLLEIGRQMPDVLLADLMMPGMDGFHMIASLKAQPEYRNMEIIAISAMSPHEIDSKGGLPSDVVLLHKPVSPAAIVSRVEQALERRRSAAGAR